MPGPSYIISRQRIQDGGGLIVLGRHFGSDNVFEGKLSEPGWLMDTSEAFEVSPAVQWDELEPVADILRNAHGYLDTLPDVIEFEDGRAPVWVALSAAASPGTDAGGDEEGTPVVRLGPLRRIGDFRVATSDLVEMVLGEDDTEHLYQAWRSAIGDVHKVVREAGLPHDWKASKLGRQDILWRDVERARAAGQEDEAILLVLPGHGLWLVVHRGPAFDYAVREAGMAIEDGGDFTGAPSEPGLWHYSGKASSGWSAGTPEIESGPYWEFEGVSRLLVQEDLARFGLSAGDLSRMVTEAWKRQSGAQATAHTSDCRRLQSQFR